MMQILKNRDLQNRTQIFAHTVHKLSIDEFQYSLTNTIY